MTSTLSFDFSLACTVSLPFVNILFSVEVLLISSRNEEKVAGHDQHMIKNLHWALCQWKIPLITTVRKQHPVAVLHLVTSKILFTSVPACHMTSLCTGKFSVLCLFVVQHDCGSWAAVKIRCHMFKTPGINCVWNHPLHPDIHALRVVRGSVFTDLRNLFLFSTENGLKS